MRAICGLKQDGASAEGRGSAQYRKHAVSSAQLTQRTTYAAQRRAHVEAVFGRRAQAGEACSLCLGFSVGQEEGVSL